MDKNHPYTITAKPRHLKLLFFINEDYQIAQLRKLAIKNLSLWGGRINPLVPVKQGGVTSVWRELLKYQDPDYCYISKGIEIEFIRELCDQYQLNPIEIIELDDRFLDIHGVHFANLMPVLPASAFPNIYQLSGIDSTLKDYFALNFFVADTLPVNKGAYSHTANEWLFKKHTLVLINQGNFNDVNHYLALPFLSNITTLSEYNTPESKLRQLNPNFNSFELVIANDEQGFDELIYHWNKALYDIHCREVLTLFMTESELQSLLTDQYFKEVLKKLSGDHLGIGVVSFSLDEEKLKKIVEQLTAYSNLNRFELKVVDNFPYAIRDRQGLNQKVQYEKETAQVIYKSQPFVFMPPLSFEIEFKPFSQRYGFDLKISEILGPFNKSLRFPARFNSDIMVKIQSRINRRREIFVSVDEHSNLEGKLNLNIYEFYHVINATVTSPKITGSRDIKNIYRGVQYSDGSNKLAQFLKLFNEDFLFLQDFLHDKFWNDIFLELAGNAKAEGDTITFDEIYTRCYKIMLELGRVFTTKEKGRFNEENLKLGLKNILQTLSEHKIFLPGFVIKCNSCSSKVWYSIAEIKETIVCKGCSNSNHFKAENPIAYKLNNLVKNNYGMKSEKGVFVPDGNMTAVSTLIHIWNKAVNSFQYLPQIDIYDCSGDHKPMTDLDIIAISAGTFYIGECKHSSDLFFDNGNKSLLNMIEIASKIKPDKIILACTNDVNNKLDKAVKFLNHHMISWKHKPEVVPYVAWVPEYFGTNESRYFYY